MKTPKRGEWLRAWPNHCPTCEGHTDCANPCQDCLGAGFRCPRCGQRETHDGRVAIHREDAAIPCRVCGWVEDAGMGCPPSREMIRARKREENETAERERQRAIVHHRQALTGLLERGKRPR